MPSARPAIATSQRAYLVQLRRAGAGSALIDPIAVPDLAAVQEATAGVEWILHAANQDLPCLAEVGLRPHSLFDTELAGRLLGRERVSLGALVLSELGQVLEKGHGSTDWSVRPLSAAQLRYAVLDVELLVELRDVMAAELEATGKAGYAREEFDALLSFTARERGEDEWRRTSGIHRIRRPRQLAVVRSLWLVRDDIARQRDIAVGRVLPDAAIVAAAQADPQSMDGLAGPQGVHRPGRPALPAALVGGDRGCACRAGRPLAAGHPAGNRSAAAPQLGRPRSRGLRPARGGPRVDGAHRCASRACRSRTCCFPMPCGGCAGLRPQPVDEESVAAFLTGLGARRWQIGLTVDALARGPDGGHRPRSGWRPGGPGGY